MDHITSSYQPSSALHSSHYLYYPAPTAVILPPLTMQQLHSPYYRPHLPYSSYTTISPSRQTQSLRDEVRTLFVAGLPEDVKPREIYNLFRVFPGYESSHLRSPTKTSQPFAFAVFVDQASAVAAMQSLNGMVFDLERGSTLHIDLAKAKSKSKRPSADDERTGSDKRAKGPVTTTSGCGTLNNGFGSTHTSGISNSAYNTTGYPPIRSHDISPNDVPMGKGNYNMASSASNNPQDNPPCPTLFVANLGPQCTEHELAQAFSRCSGFLKLKMQRLYGSPVAFIDFLDTDSSTTALINLQGTVLDSSLHGESMRLEYAKSRMGTRKSK